MTERKTLPYPFPFKCRSWPESSNQNYIADFIKFYQSAGHIKKCGHISIKEVGEYGGKYWPNCSESSFLIKNVGSQESHFFGCPKDCHFYEPAWKAKAKRGWKKYYWNFRDGLVGIASWYSTLAPTVQVILAVALLALFSSPWATTVQEIVKLLMQK